MLILFVCNKKWSTLLHLKVFLKRCLETSSKKTSVLFRLEINFLKQKLTAYLFILIYPKNRVRKLLNINVTIPSDRSKKIANKIVDKNSCGIEFGRNRTENSI